MTENERFKYVRNKYKHYVHDTEKDGEWKKGYIGTYGEFDLDKLTIELNKRENKINHLKNENEQFRNIARDYNIPFNKLCNTFEDVLEENEQLKQEIKELQGKASGWKITASEEMMKQSELMKENGQLKKVIDEADDLIKSHLTNHYKTRWKHICEYYGVDIE